MIIDAHTFISPHKDGFGPGRDATLEALLREMDRCAVERAVILPIAATVPYIKRTSNDFVQECCTRYPDRLTGFASIHPTESPDPVALLRETLGRFNFQGLKIHPRFMGCAASDDAVIALVKEAARHDIPVAVDGLLWKPTPLDQQTPFHVDRLCKAVPQARIILCHTGGFRFLDALAVAKANDNVYFDLSLILEYFAGTPFEDQFLFVLKEIGANRLIFGSDHPQSPMAKSYAACREVLTRHGFSQEEQQWIFGKTFESLLPGNHA